MMEFFLLGYAYSFRGLFELGQEEVAYALYVVLFVFLVAAAIKRAWGWVVTNIIGFAFVMIFVQQPQIIETLGAQILQIFSV